MKVNKNVCRQPSNIEHEATHTHTHTHTQTHAQARARAPWKLGPSRFTREGGITTRPKPPTIHTGAGEVGLELPAQAVPQAVGAPAGGGEGG